MEELMKIQQELHAPKNQLNKFGNYNYRSCEDILLAVKPLLAKYECVLLLSDEIKELSTTYNLRVTKNDKNGQEDYEYSGTRVYVEATAMLVNKNGQSISVKGLAREEPYKKGQDSSQTTGATSSYARKYALNGLFCIDDNKDADATNTHGKDEGEKSTQKPAATPAQKVTTPAPAPTPVTTNIIAAPKGWSKDEVKKRIFASNTTGELMSIHMTYGDEQEISSLLTERKHQIIKANGTQ